MAITFFPCTYIDPESSIPCGQFFAESEVKSLFCPTHRNAMSPASDETKPKFISATNEENKFCHEMTLDELDVHISKIGVAIEELKAKYYAARGVRANKLDLLSEEDRKARRDWKSTAAPKADAPKKSISVKDNPVGHLTQKLNIKRKDALDLLSMDMDELLDKYKKSSEAKAQ